MSNNCAFNPYLPSYEYVPDGEPRVFGDRLYIYGSHDKFDGKGFCLLDYVCYSAPLSDLSNFRYEGIIYRAAQDPANKKNKMHMNAPDCVQGVDGRYYLYYALHAVKYTSVAVADSPAGPFEYYGVVSHKDQTPYGNKKGDVYAFDPGVFVDEDQRVYCYLGFAPVGGFKKLLQMRGNKVDGAVCLELASDMKTILSEEKMIVPGPELARGTEFEGHSFFEASSMRKFNGNYYFVYSSQLSHELCYAISKYPDRDFSYGGTLISIADIGYKKNTVPKNYPGNTHGGMALVNGQYYIFYHRQTNRQNCARQGCAEKIEIHEDGAIDQVEMTSCGLNSGNLPGKGRYEARIACNLMSREGVFHAGRHHERDKKKIHPYFTQSGVDRECDGDQYIANMTHGAKAGFKYFDFQGDCRTISVSYRGKAKGKLVVFADEKQVASLRIDEAPDWSNTSSMVEPEALSGVKAIYFLYEGEGSMDFEAFAFE